jgi:hypothetical protein
MKTPQTRLTAAHIAKANAAMRRVRSRLQAAHLNPMDTREIIELEDLLFNSILDLELKFLDMLPPIEIPQE